MLHALCDPSFPLPSSLSMLRFRRSFLLLHLLMLCRQHARSAVHRQDRDRDVAGEIQVKTDETRCFNFVDSTDKPTGETFEARCDPLCWYRYTRGRPLFGSGFNLDGLAVFPETYFSLGSTPSQEQTINHDSSAHWVKVWTS